MNGIYGARLAAAKEWVKKAKRIVFLGGAGVSTGSGISDFRSEKGLYNIRSKYGVPYEQMLSHTYFKQHTDTFYRFYWETMVHPEAKPNSAQEALADFEAKNPYRISIVTQNIDGLHQKAGSKRVYEVHGTVASYHCLDCGKAYSLDQIPHHGVPLCSCGGVLKPDVVLYEEPLDEETLLSAVNCVRFADLLIVGGTSLRVQPVASLPDYFSGGRIVLINQEPTYLDARADAIFREDIGQVLNDLLEE